MIQARAEEILLLAWDQVLRVEANEHVHTGSTIVGGGALLPGMDRLVANVTGTEARRADTLRNEMLGEGESNEPGGRHDPAYAAAIGALLLHVRRSAFPLDRTAGQEPLWRRVIGRLRAFAGALAE
jgi:cell division ATPase FtsA